MKSKAVGLLMDIEVSMRFCESIQNIKAPARMEGGIEAGALVKTKRSP